MAPKNRPITALHARSVNTPSYPPMAGNQNGKRRAVDVVDLTGSDDEAARQPRKLARSENHPRTRASSPTQQGQGVDEDGADDVIFLSQDGEIGGADEMFELYGLLHTKIVGVQYYTGYATVGEHVLIRREPSNRYDSNAIRVDNVQRDQIGHIPRQVSAKLAPFIDSGSLMVEGVLSGNKGQYDCPLAVSLYGTSTPADQEALKNRMKASGLPIDVLQRKEKEAQKRRAAELKNAAKNAKVPNGVGSKRWDHGGPHGNFAGCSSQSLEEPSESLEDIILESERFNPREMGQVVEKFGAGEEALSQMPMAENPERLATSLLPYQLQGLAWLLDKENPQLPAAGSTDVVQLWKRTPTDPRAFTNIATNFSLKNVEPKLASGGILADDMGLGKTLEVVALIVADLAASKSTPPKPGNETKATLIVAPLSVMSNWSGQVCSITPCRP